MKTESTSEFPHALRGIQVRTIRRQEVQHEAFSPLLSPVLVQSGMVVFRVVGNDHGSSSRADANPVKVFQELPAGRGVELACLPPEEESAVAQADRAKVTHALSGGMMEQDGVFDFRRHPHPAARAVLLKMDFVHRPKVNRGIGA